MIASVTKNLVLIGLIGLTLALVASADKNCKALKKEYTAVLELKDECLQNMNVKDAQNAECFSQLNNIDDQNYGLQLQLATTHQKCCRLCRK